MPVVSVLMVTHRDTPFLRPAIASVLAQTFADFELVLVDNGSGLSHAALGEMGRDPRVRWVRLPRNLGIPGGHNAGVAAALGEFIALLDHDDLMLPARLERQVALLRAKPALALVSSQAETIDGDGRVTGREFSLTDDQSQLRYTQYAAPVVTPAYTGRRTVFAELPYRAELPLAADFDFLARAAEKFSFGTVPDVLLRYRRHTSQASQEHASAFERDCCTVRLLTARRRAGRPENFPAVRAAPGAAPSPGESCYLAAKQCLGEKFFALSAYHARREFVLGRSLADAWLGGWIALHVLLWARGEERRLAARLFLRGPVRALKLS